MLSTRPSSPIRQSTTPISDRPVDVEFVDGPSEGDDHTEELGDRPPRFPRWVPVAVIAAVALIAGVVIIQRSADDDLSPRAAPTASPVVNAPFTPPFPTPSAVPSRIRDLDPTLFTIYSTARDSVPAQDVVRAGSSTGNCKSVKIGSRPKVRAASAVVQTLTEFSKLRFSELDAAAIIDQDAGLCSLQIRAADGAGVVAVVIITAPDGSTAPTTDRVRVGSGIVGADAVEYVQYRNLSNWLVTVGAAGVESRLPPTALLRRLASDAALRW